MRLIAEGVMAPLLNDAGVTLAFTRDYLFTSPSLAACIVMGRAANGWIEWKDAIGRTLDEVKRQPMVSISS